jgi:site-specific recombinase XerD
VLHNAAPDLGELLKSWELALRAERKSPQTIKSYSTGVRQFLTWCQTAEIFSPKLDRPTVAAFVADLLEQGAEPTTAQARLAAVKRFSAWLAEEGELPRDELLGMRPPKLDTKVVEPLSDDQLRALLKACSGGDPFRDRRDEAIVRVMLETGARAGEVAAMTLSDVNLLAGTAVIRRGKGGKGRVVPFGPQTVRALDRYIRTRRSHRLAATDALWLGDRGRGFTYSALYKALGERAQAAGITGFHPHRLRHSLAHRWLAAGGTEHGLMAVAGWSTPAMLGRYTKAQAEQRAADEARRLNLGDL